MWNKYKESRKIYEADKDAYEKKRLKTEEVKTPPRSENGEE